MADNENELENGNENESTELENLTPRTDYEAAVQATGDHNVFADSELSDSITFRTIRAFGVQFSVYESVVAASEQGQSWDCVFEVIGVDSDNRIRTGQAITVLARVFDAFAPTVPLFNDGTNVDKITYTCERKTKGLYNQEWSPVPGHSNIQVDNSCLLDTLENPDNWTRDDVGVNFMMTPDITTRPLFPELGNYRIVVRIDLVDGNPVVFYNYVTVVDDPINNVNAS